MHRPDTIPFPQTTPVNQYEYLTQPIATKDTPQLSIEEQLANAHYVAGALHAAIGYLGMQTRSQERTTPLDTTNASMSDIARSIIRGRPITIEPTDMITVSSIGNEHPRVGIGPNDRLAKALGQLFRSIAPHPSQIGYATPILDGYDAIWRTTLGQKHDTRGVLYSKETRKQILMDTWDMQKREGIVGLTDMAGHDYTLVPTAQHIGTSEKRGALIHALRESKWGEVVTDAAGALAFRSGPELQSIYRPTHASQAIRLTDQFGLETSATLYTEAIRGILQHGSQLHVMGPNPRVSEASILLRATDDITRQRYHSIGVHNGNWSGTTPEYYAFDVAQQLEKHAQDFITNRQRFADFKDFDPDEYAKKWYGREQVLIDDQQICQAVGTVLRMLNMHVQRAVDVGCGPNLYPGMLMLPYTEILDLLEFAPTNREYVTNYLTRTPSQEQLRMWKNFIPYMKQGGGDIYRKIDSTMRDRAKQGSVRVKPCDVFDLQETWELMSAYFVIDSISTYFEDQYAALASMTNSLEAEGLMIVASMLNQEGHVGYKAGANNEYPNLSQNTGGMKQTFLDNDLFPMIIRIGGDQRKIRSGYNGMAVIFACHKGSKRQQQLISLIPTLTQLGFDIVA